MRSLYVRTRWFVALKYYFIACSDNTGDVDAANHAADAPGLFAKIQFPDGLTRMCGMEF